ncbi:MAG: hypothetical protein KDA46_13400, partial [Parvularculaceae bacterium]|nr:hypothetical protein [Parvularculaceae bacterium]
SEAPPAAVSANPAPVPAPAKVGPAPVVAAKPSPAPAPKLTGHPLAQATQVNPVGDVHERIRRMLTEGSPEGLSTPQSGAPSTPVPRPASRPPVLPEPSAEHANARNPFREAAEELQRTSLAALDMLKSLGGQPPRREEPEVRVQEPVRAKKASHGDLFDDEEDNELEIPSFLRKKKVS